MTGPALLLSADHADPGVAAREARRRIGSVDRDRLVDAVAAQGFETETAWAAVASMLDDDSTRSCARGVDSHASDN